MIGRHIKLTLLLSFICSISIVSAQLKTAPEPNLDNPFNTIYVHLYYLQSDSYEPEISALTIAPFVDSLEAQEIAIKIKQIYDGSGLYVQLNRIPKDANFRDTVNQDSYYTPFPNEIPELYLEKIDGKWYYSRETISLVPGVHKSLYPLGSDFLVKILPRQANSKFLGLFVWQHLGILIILLLAIGVFFVIDWSIILILRLFSSNRENWKFVDKDRRKKVARYSSIALSLWFIIMMVPALQLPVRGSEFANKTLEIFIAITLMMFGITLVNIFSHRAHSVTQETETKMDEQLLPILKRMMKVVIVIVTTFFILNLLNVNVTALIAGVSIGGLALALAAQDTVKNLIASAMIFADRPFQIGDYVIAGGQEGSVVEVGFRSTRIQQVDTSIITIPNGTIANMAITNLGVRQSRLFNITIGVVYGTSPDKIEGFIAELKDLIINHPKTKEEPFYVHFREMADSSLNIMFRCYLDTQAFPEELAIKEDIMLEILRIAERLGIGFAFPSMSVYMENAE